MRMDADRFKEYSGGKEADAISLGKPETLELLNNTPALVLYENNTAGKNADVVRYGLLRDVQFNKRYILFRLEQQVAIPRERLNTFSSRLGLETLELNRTHWAVKEGGIPAAFLAGVGPPRSTNAAEQAWETPSDSNSGLTFLDFIIRLRPTRNSRGPRRAREGGAGSQPAKISSERKRSLGGRYMEEWP